MSELDLGSSTTPTSPAPASPGTDLVLQPPAPVVVVEKEQAAGAVPVDNAKQAELRAKAEAFAAELAALDTRSPAFTQKVNSITTMGDNEMRSSAAVSSRMLERPAAAMNAHRGRGTPGDAQTRVANTLVDLRQTITELDPNRADLTGVKKVLKWLPGGDKIQRYFAKYESAQTHLNAIIKSLEAGQDDLRKDNAAIETEKVNMWTTMGKLSEYNQLATALDEAVTNKVAELEASSQSESANALKSDALFAIRQRRQDIMTQLAVS